MTVVANSRKNTRKNSLKINSIDRWAYAFFQDLLDEKLSAEEFERVVSEHWNAGDFIVSAPRTAEYFYDLALTFDKKSRVAYSSNDPNLNFRSHWLVGKPDRPGAVYINAPAEKKQQPRLSEMNRPVHMHDTGRINLITSGNAVFLFQAVNDQEQRVVVSCPVSTGDIVFWPGGTPHTFNARDGFSVLSSMPVYVSPEQDGYTIKYPHRLKDLDTLPVLSVADYQAQKF